MESLRDGLQTFLYLLTIIFAVFSAFVVWRYYKGTMRTMFIVAVAIMTFFWIVLGAFFLPATVFAGQLCLKYETNVDVAMRVHHWNATREFHYYARCNASVTADPFPYATLRSDVSAELARLEANSTHPSNHTRQLIANLTALVADIDHIR